MKQYTTPNIRIWIFRNSIKMTTASGPEPQEWVEALRTIDNKQKVKLEEFGQLMEFNF